MGWPPQVGDLLPRAEEAIGIRQKLSTYSLEVSHEDGGSKAQGFARILGITLETIDYLEEEIEKGIRVARISAVRPNPPHGLNCVVEFPICGVNAFSRRAALLRTVWIFASTNSRPRLITAFLEP